MSLETPVALLIYNRPEPTARVLAAIARARPQTLLVVGDGPRQGCAEDAQRVAAARALLSRVDWPCDVQTDFAPANLGCRRRVATGLDWVFEQVPEAIILEDDCVPSLPFFDFCRDLLERYRDDCRVHSISGTNFDDQTRWTPDSYFFSQYFHCWGWASWRRAWRSFDVELREWPAWKSSGGLKAMASSAEEVRYWTKTLDSVHRGELNSWALAFAFAAFRSRGLQAIPAANLVSNIGFGTSATHTTQQAHPLANLPVGNLGTLRHPAAVARHQPADRHIFATAYRRRPSRWARLRSGWTRAGEVLRTAWRTIRRQKRIGSLRHQLETARQRQIIVGAGGTSQAGWIATDIRELNLLLPEEWLALCQPATLDALLAEHVWEHLTVEDGLTAARTCFQYLKPGGRLRVAVPDGFHPDPDYVASVRPQGTGPGAADHQVLYNYRTFQQLFESTGFEVQMLEYFDEHGKFQARDWTPEDGLVQRSRRFDPRNQDGQLRYTSIILDALKPPATARQAPLPLPHAA